MHQHLAHFLVDTTYSQCRDLNELVSCARRVYQQWLLDRGVGPDQGSPYATDYSPLHPNISPPPGRPSSATHQPPLATPHTTLHSSTTSPPDLTISPWSPTTTIARSSGGGSRWGEFGSVSKGGGLASPPVRRTPACVTSKYSRVQVWQQVQGLLAGLDNFLGAAVKPEFDADPSGADKQLLQTLSKSNRYLLLAAFICSHNPDKTDQRILGPGVRQSIRQKKGELRKEVRETVRQFSLQRLMDVYAGISDKSPAQVQDTIAGQLLHLQPWDFVHQTQSDPPRYKCMLSRSLSCTIASSLKLNLNNYLMTTKG